MLAFRRALFTSSAAVRGGGAVGTQRAVVGIGSGFSTTTADTSYYLALGGVGGATLNTVQANGAYPWRGAGRFKNLHVTSSSNTRGSSATTVTVQKAGVDTALAVSFPANTATTQSNTSNTITVADGDLIGIHIRTNGGAGTFTPRAITLQFETDGQVFTHIAFFGGASNNATTNYYAPRGSGVSTTTEASAEVMKALEAFTASHMHALISANAASTTATFLSQDNSGDGNQTFNVLATVTGLGEDTNAAHTDAIAADEKLTIRKSSTTGNITVLGGGFKAVWATAGRTQVGALQASTSNAGATSFGGMFGPALVGTTESQAQQKMPFAARFSKLCCFVTTNPSTTQSVLTLRIAGADTSVTVTIAAGATGFMTASANTADCAAGDLISTKLVGHDGNIVLAWVGMMVTDLNAGS